MTPPAKSCSDKAKGFLIQHWTVSTLNDPRCKTQPKYICSPSAPGKCMTLPWIKFKRWHLLVASFLDATLHRCDLFMVGAISSWSVPHNPIDLRICGKKDKAWRLMHLHISVGMIGTTTATMGPWLKRNGPRSGMMLDTTSFMIDCVINCISLHANSIVGLLY
ncbi:unnamed protein product [Peronospora farinosa]|uniref:Uncharacterized protein n=1 Tax=Peronospora farinosa TaxID=134698 RepID=A0ABN8CHF7_9STRA|nr:unnamed protein product [Peronospora farinosa]